MNVPAIGSYTEISGYAKIQITGDPNADAQSFATANNISLEEAKSVLQANFGAPSTSAAKDTGVIKAVTQPDNEEDVEVVDNNSTSSVSGSASGSTSTDSAKATATDKCYTQADYNKYKNDITAHFLFSAPSGSSGPSHNEADTSEKLYGAAEMEYLKNQITAYFQSQGY